MANTLPDKQKIQDEHWLRELKKRKPDHPVVRATFAPFANIVASTVKKSKNASVLEVGCGNGYLQWTLENIFQRVAGLDYSEQRLAINPCKEKHLGSCTDLPFDDKSFDVVVASHLLHHLLEVDRVQTLLEMKRVARQAIVSFEPNRGNPLMFLFALINKEERMALSFSPNYMRNLFTKAGFSSVDVHVEGWIVPNMAPNWWIPVGHFIGETPLKKMGFDICTISRL